MIIIGVDVGQENDYTAIVILRPVLVDGQRKYDCLWCERLPLGMPYRDMILRVKVHKENIGEKCVIIIDSTGVGRPVVEETKRLIRGCRIIGLTITGGLSVHGWNVPKRDLITNLQLMIQGGSLRVSSKIKYLPALWAELKGYKVEITKNAKEEFGPWRDKDHDDLVLALSIAGFVGTRLYPLRKAS